LALTHLTSAIDKLRSLVELKGSVSKGMKEHTVAHIVDLGSILGIFQNDKFKFSVSNDVLALINEREKLRKAGKYKESDEIRNKLKKDHKTIVEDSEYGTLWYKEY
jgi:cysteinyl-tRNA synthetase